MSVWMEMYEDADRVLGQLRAKKITIEEAQAQGAFINLKIKSARGEATCEIAASRVRGLRNSFKSKRLIANDGTAMGATAMLPPGEERLKCPGQGSERVITRQQCLDRSGKAENLEDCKDCDYYKINRDLVLGPKPYVA